MNDTELDLTVAKAAGLRSAEAGQETGDCFYFDVEKHKTGSSGWVEFHPSTDFSDAMEAAKKVGLFQLHEDKHGSWRWHITQRPDGDYVLSRRRDRNHCVIDSCETIINGSGPRAICEAIVAMKWSE